MKIAHLILAHKNPQQVERLMNAMQHPNFSFFIHVDQKTDQSSFLYLAQKQNTFLIKNRTKIYWAGYGTIQATINGFEEILQHDFDYINVISGQDFPIKSPQLMYDFIAERSGTQFITCESIDDEWAEAAPRVRNYHFINWRIPGKFRLQFLANKILPKRKYPLNHKIVGRANWFTITKDAAAYILSFLQKNPSVVNYYRYCWGADEFIFATTLYNSGYQPRIVNNLVYVDWTGQTKGHPRILGIEDAEKITASGKLFARKLEAGVSDELFSYLERQIAMQQ
jgi:hypothetical protein